MHRSNSRSHRHFVALPLLMVALLLPSIHGAFRASVLSADQPESVPVFQDARGLSLPDGVRMLLYDGASVDTATDIPEVEDGSVLVSANGYAELSLGNRRLVKFLDGTVHLTRYEDSTVIAALTTPVLVQYGDRRTLIAPGQQWRNTGEVLPSAGAGYELWLHARRTNAVPRRTLEEQVRNTALLPAFVSSRSSAAGLQLPLPEGFPLLPGAKQRAEQAERTEVLAALSLAVQNRDAARTENLLKNGALVAGLQLPNVQRSLVQLLLQSAAHADVAAPIASVLSGNQDLWLLMSMHPGISAVSGVFAEPMLVSDAALIDAFFFPAADTRQRAFGDLALRQWGDRMSDFLADTSQQVALLDSLVPATDKTISRLLEQEYPERAYRLAAVARRSIAEHRKALDPRMEAIVASWESIDAVSIRAQQVSSVSSSVVSASRSSLSSAEKKPASPAVQQDELIAQAQQQLITVGALISLDTKFRVTEEGTVAITGFLISNGKRDRRFSAILDTQAQQVSDITEGATVYPYRLPLLQFADWARQS